MSKITFMLLTLLMTSVNLFAGDVNVRGYTRKDGTYVAPHTRSATNAYKWDNKNYSPSQPAYNDSYSKPTKNYGSEWYTPSTTRFQDSNPYNDSPPNSYSLPKLPSLNDYNSGDE